jgi:hypothetical protein
VVFYYWSRRNGGPQYCRGEVESVNDGVAEVIFENGRFQGVLRRHEGDIFWDSNSRERCRFVSHWDPSGGPVIALVCPKCGRHISHSCQVPPPPCNGFQRGDRVVVRYAPTDGLEAGTCVGFVVRAFGHVIRVHLQHGGLPNKTAHLARNASGVWVDLQYGVPCEVGPGE